jgi:hypothetical protein
LIEHNLCGHKFTKLYPLTGAEKQALQGQISSHKIASTNSAIAYPNCLTDAELAIDPVEPVVVSIEANEDGIGLVYSSIIALRVREEIEFESFDDPENMRERFDEVIGLKYKRVQLFHVVWVPHHRNFLEIRVDAPDGIGDAVLHGLHSEFKKILNQSGAVAIDKPVNLFPAVRRFYDDDKNGIVSEITFATTTSAIKNEKMMRRSASQLDQRSERYHLKGKEGLGTEIAVFRIVVEWAFKEDSVIFTPTLSLAASGPSGKGDGGNPVISGAKIANCIRCADYEFVIERLGQKADMNDVAAA